MAYNAFNDPMLYTVGGEHDQKEDIAIVNEVHRYYFTNAEGRKEFEFLFKMSVEESVRWVSDAMWQYCKLNEMDPTKYPFTRVVIEAIRDVRAWRKERNLKAKAKKHPEG